jgi:hypothetical protein
MVNPKSRGLKHQEPHMAALFEKISKIAPLPYAGIIRIRFEGSSVMQTLSRSYSPRA